jgi:hypothetical protein
MSSQTTQRPATTALVRNPTVNLDKAIMIKSKDGTEVIRIKTFMKLSTTDGTLVKIMDGKKAYGDYPARLPTLIPSATAYMAMAARCGVNINHPDTVIVDGVEQPNGYRSKEGTYYFRSQAGGFTANGQPFITDRTIDYDVFRYNLQDMLAKAKYDENKRYFKLAPNKGHDKDGGFKGAPGDNWAGYQVDGGVILWVDCNCPNLIGWLSEMNNRIKNAIRTAQTFADRNAIAAHPALPVRKKFETPETYLECVSWVSKNGNNTFKMLQEDSHVTIDVSSTSIVADDEETRLAVQAEAAAAPVDVTDVVPEEEEPEKKDNLKGVKKTDAPATVAPEWDKMAAIAEIGAWADNPKTKASKLHGVMKQVGILMDEGQTHEMASDEQLKALQILIKC